MTRIIDSPVETDEDLIALASKVYDGLTDEEVNEIERIACNRADFFGAKTHDDDPATSTD